MARILLLGIGDELLSGAISNTNASWLAQQLTLAGFEVAEIRCVGDNLAMLSEEFRRAIAAFDVVISTGGLGPTDDDNTFAAVAEGADRALVLFEAVRERNQARFKRAGYTYSKNNDKQAFLPKGSTLLPNDVGTAPSIELLITCADASDTDPASSARQCRVYCMPGVPREMKWLFTEHVLPRLRSGLTQAQRTSVHFRTFGLGESALENNLQDVIAKHQANCTDLRVHYRTSFPENMISFDWPTADASPVKDTGSLITSDVMAVVGKHVFSRDPDDRFPQALLRCLTEKGLSLSAVESCTGGLIADLLVRYPGASAVFKGGLVAYDNEVKQRLFDQYQQAIQTCTENNVEMLIDTHGAVSKATSIAMALAGRAKFGTDFCVATSGISGPGGGSADKPVGTVHIAVATPDGQITHQERKLPYDRNRNRHYTAQSALWLIHKWLHTHC